MTDLAERVKQFNTLQLPGQPMGMHTGTSNLVNDLWREIERLAAAVLMEREACAETALAEDSFMMLQDFGMQSMCTQVRENVAAAIRARSKS